MPLRPVLLALAALIAALGVAAPTAGATDRSCGTVMVEGTSVEVVVLRATTCATARKVTRSIHGRPVVGWACVLYRSPYERLGGRAVVFGCGKGGRNRNPRTWPHAFVGTVDTGSSGPVIAT